MKNVSFIAASFCFLVNSFAVRADTIPTLFGSSAIASAPHGGPIEFSITGDTFSLGGFVPAPQVGIPFQLGSYSTSFSFRGGNNGPMGSTVGRITLDGFTTFSMYAGSGVVSAPDITIFSLAGLSSDFVLTSGHTAVIVSPASPVATFVLPATMSGTFTACRTADGFSCTSPSLANVAVDSPGVLTIVAKYRGPIAGPIVLIDESFTTVPEPSSMAYAAPVLGLIAIRRAAKSKRRSP
jgi:hypothetical protein